MSIDTKEGAKLADGLVKWITGGDDIAARRLYERTFEFSPQFTLLLASNYRPRVRDDDDAFWRRLIELPFVISIPEAERDKTVKATLCDPKLGGPAVLSWAVQGAVRWFKEGLALPEIVRTATAAYRDEMDPMRDFLSTVCVLEKDASVAAGEIRTAYELGPRNRESSSPSWAKPSANACASAAPSPTAPARNADGAISASADFSTPRRLTA